MTPKRNGAMGFVASNGGMTYELPLNMGRRELRHRSFKYPQSGESIAGVIALTPLREVLIGISP
jgi:hypothetical protein